MTDKKENTMPQLKTLNGILALIDIVNFTHQANKLGDHHTAQYINYFQEKINSIAKKHDYTPIKSMGDAVLIFGTEPEGILDIMKDLFQRDKPEDKFGFQSRFRMVAHTGYFQFQMRQEKPVDLVSAEAIKVFRLEKNALAWELVVTHELYRGIKSLLSEKNIDAHRFTPDQPLKGFDNEEWFPPFYKLHIMKEYPDASGLLERKMTELKENVQTIPVFGEIYPPVPMENNFINLTMFCDDQGALFEKTAPWTPAKTFDSPTGREGDKDDWIYFRHREREVYRDFIEIDVNGLYERYKQGIIFGLPGAGKTTIMRHLAFKEFNANKIKDEKDRQVVLFVPCRGIPQYDEWYKKRYGEETAVIDVNTALAYMTWVFLFGEKKETDLAPRDLVEFQEAAKQVKQAFKEKRLTLLLDALDEAPDRDAKEKTRELFLALLSENRLFLTSRPSEQIHLQQDKVPVFNVRSLEMDQVRKIAQQLISEKSRIYKKFDDAIWKEEIVVKIAATPMIALLVTAYFQAYERFDHRYPMYDLLVKFILLNTWEKIKQDTFKHKNLSLLFKEIKEPDFFDLNPETHILYDALALLCYELFYDSPDGRARRTVNEDTLLLHFTDFMTENLYYHEKDKSVRQAHQWLEQFHRDHLLIQVGPVDYMFVHSTVMEYLAANYLVEQRQRHEEKFLPLVRKCQAREDYLELETIPIAAGSDMLTGFKITGLLRDLETPYPRQRLLEFSIKCLAELEWLTEKTMHAIQIERLKEPFNKLLHQNRDTFHWLYAYIKNQVLSEDKEELKKAHKRFAQHLHLCRRIFLEEYLDYREFNIGDSQLVDLREKLLYCLVQKEVVDQWLAAHRQVKPPKLRGEASAEEIALLDLDRVLQLDTKEYHPEDRNFKYYQQAVGKELVGFFGSPNMKHSGSVRGCAFAPDGKTFVSASDDGTLKLWDVASGKELRTFAGHKYIFRDCAFSPDGQRLVSASNDKTLKLWDAASGKEMRIFTGHQSYVNSCVFSPDGTRLVSASDDHTLKLWDAGNGKEMRTFTGHNAPVCDCTFAPDGKTFVSASDDGTLKLWDAVSGMELRTFAGHQFAVWGCAFSPDGERLVSASADQTLKLWDAASGKEIRTFAGHQSAVWGCAFSPDGERLVSASDDQTLKLWDAASGKEMHTFTGHKSAVLSCAFSPDGQRLVSTSRNQTLKLWDAVNGKEMRTFTGHNAPVCGCAFSPDGTRLLSASSDQTLKLWDAASGNEMRTFAGHKDAVWGCAFSPDGQRLVSASYDQTLKLWDAASGNEMRTITGHKASVLGCAFSPDGTRLVSASDDQTLKLWDAAGGKEMRTFTGHKDAVWGCAFSPDGQRLVSASYDQTLKLWDAANGNEMRTFTGHKDYVRGCAFSPDGTRLLSASSDQTLKLWDAASGQELRTLTGHKASVWGCAFSPDGTRLLSASSDHTLKLWDATNSQCLKTVELPWIPLFVAFSPRHPHLAVTANANGTLTLFDFKEYST